MHPYSRREPCSRSSDRASRVTILRTRPPPDRPLDLAQRKDAQHIGGMSRHLASLVWSRDGRPFTYEQYGRDHRVTYGTGTAQDVSAASEYRGNPALPNPEELLVAALSSCHMLTFLAIAAKKKLVVERYEDEAVGILARPEGGPMQVTEVTLRPRITFEGAPPDAATLASMHEQAHRGCFIANSVRTQVHVEH